MHAGGCPDYFTLMQTDASFSATPGGVPPPWRRSPTTMLSPIAVIEDQDWLVDFMGYDLRFFDKEQDRVEPDPIWFAPDMVLILCPE